MSAEALRAGVSKGSPIHTMQKGKKNFHCAVEVYSLILNST